MYQHSLGKNTSFSVNTKSVFVNTKLFVFAGTQNCCTSAQQLLVIETTHIGPLSYTYLPE